MTFIILLAGLCYPSSENYFKAITETTLTSSGMALIKLDSVLYQDFLQVAMGVFQIETSA